MRNLRIARTTLLCGAVCAALLGAGNGLAYSSSGNPHVALDSGEAWQFSTPPAADAQAAPAPTLEQMLEPFNFQNVDAATYTAQHGAMGRQLTGRGLGKTVRGFVDAQQVDTWYSAAEDRSVVCVTGADGGRYSQAVYVTPGKVRRADIVPLP